MKSKPNYWCVVPAAGVGKRMGAEHPKQYLRLMGQTICEHSLSRLLQVDCLRAIVVAVAADDPHWSQLTIAEHPKIISVEGGRERADSVLNGLRYLATRAEPDDWVMVHDVARPCVRPADIEQLISTTQAHNCGGILATPVRDTLKKATAEQQIAATLDRDGLWHALTPQLFPLQQLLSALEAAIAQGATITDEASAIEWAGSKPILVAGHPDNIKITHPQDLPLAELFLGAVNDSNWSRL